MQQKPPRQAPEEQVALEAHGEPGDGEKRAEAAVALEETALR